MGKRMSYEPGTFSYAELATTDIADAKRFYGGLFGWGYEDVPVHEGEPYTVARIEGDSVAGLTPQAPQQREAGIRPHWFNYVTVASADDTAARTKELGGTVHAGPFDVMDIGRMAVIADPTGAMFGAWEPRSGIGAERVNEPGCLTWNDLATNDVDAATEFYSGLFGWSVRSSTPATLPRTGRSHTRGAPRVATAACGNSVRMSKAYLRTGPPTSLWHRSTSRSPRPKGSVATPCSARSTSPRAGSRPSTTSRAPSSRSSRASSTNKCRDSHAAAGIQPCRSESRVSAVQRASSVPS
jgi:predicted enzyme related to lactoylglutathione lyase